MDVLGAAPEGLKIMSIVYSVTILGNLLHIGQLFKACGDNYFTQITHIIRQFL